MAVGCAAPQQPLRLWGAPAPLQDAHEALLRAQASEAQAFAPAEVAQARQTLQEALAAGASCTSDPTFAAQQGYLVRRQAQLAQAIGSARAAQERAMEVQLALTALQEAAASDAWDTGEAQLPPSLTGALHQPWAWEQDAVAPHVDGLFDAGSSTLTARGTAVLEALTRQVVARLTDGPLRVRWAVGHPSSGRTALQAGRLAALAAYLRARGVEVADGAAGVAPGAGAAAGQPQHPETPLAWQLRPAPHALGVRGRAATD